MADVADGAAEAELTPFLATLQESESFRFADWNQHRPSVPRSGWAVYTLGADEQHRVDVGIGGWSASADEGKGLISRLTSHANGQRSGDKFCIYVCDRLIL